ncbi:4Fe-4S binding protein [Caminibacter pacificus]
MSGFLKIAIRNLLKGPTTDPYPFGDTFIPQKLRGKLKVDASECTACRTCEEVCPSGAIKITKNEGAYVHTTWYNTCCFCGNCEFFCPTGAIKLTTDFHTAHFQDEKYSFVTVAVIKETECKNCKTKFVPPSEALLKRAYNGIDTDLDELKLYCPECRKKIAFERLHLWLRH